MRRDLPSMVWICYRERQEWERTPAPPPKEQGASPRRMSGVFVSSRLLGVYFENKVTTNEIDSGDLHRTSGF